MLLASPLSDLLLAVIAAVIAVGFIFRFSLFFVCCKYIQQEMEETFCPGATCSFFFFINQSSSLEVYFWSSFLNVICCETQQQQQQHQYSWASPCLQHPGHDFLFTALLISFLYFKRTHPGFYLRISRHHSVRADGLFLIFWRDMTVITFLRCTLFQRCYYMFNYKLRLTYSSNNERTVASFLTISDVVLSAKWLIRTCFFWLQLNVSSPRGAALWIINTKHISTEAALRITSGSLFCEARRFSRCPKLGNIRWSGSKWLNF